MNILLFIVNKLRKLKCKYEILSEKAAHKLDIMHSDLSKCVHRFISRLRSEIKQFHAVFSVRNVFVLERALPSPVSHKEIKSLNVSAVAVDSAVFSVRSARITAIGSAACNMNARMHTYTMFMRLYSYIVKPHCCPGSGGALTIGRRPHHTKKTGFPKRASGV